MVSKAIAATASTTISTYVPFGGKLAIGREAARPRPEYVTLSWCSGRPAQRPLVHDGTVVVDELTGEVSMENFYYSGFFCDTGEDEELDAALEAVNTPKISISHQEGYAEHWMLQRCALYLLADGLQSKTAMRNTTDRLGVAYGWRTNKAGRTESYLYGHVLPRQILGRYGRPLVLAIKGTQTEDVLKLFYRQFDVLKLAHEVLRAQGTDMELPLWSYAMPAGPAKKQVSRGQTGRSSDIFPIVALTPEQVSVDYLAKYEVPEEHLDLLHTLCMHSVAWSSDLVARIATEQESVTFEDGANGGH
jgi:hypothetical protein